MSLARAKGFVRRCLTVFRTSRAARARRAVDAALAVAGVLDLLRDEQPAAKTRNPIGAAKTDGA